MSNSIIIYDCEIIRAIPPKEEKDRISGTEYCEGWRDFANMGLSVVCAYDYKTDSYHVYCQDNLTEFQQLINEREIYCGFNNIPFDNNLLRANGIVIRDDLSYDLLQRIWLASGLSATYQRETHDGYGLNALARLNLDEGKSGSGESAPLLWQMGKIGQVIDYCLRDCYLEKRLLDKVISDGFLMSPKTGKGISIPFAP